MPQSIDLKELALSHSRKLPGSDSFRKAWGGWSGTATEQIQTLLSQNLPHPINTSTTLDLVYNLGMAADYGVMPSFSDPGSRSGYTLDFFQCRVLLMADLIVEILAIEDRIDHKTTTNKNEVQMNQNTLYQHLSSSVGRRLQQIFPTNNMKIGTQNSNINLVSIGGGPGYDFVAAALVASYRDLLFTQFTTQSHITSSPSTISKTIVHSTIFDYETGWSNMVDCVALATGKVLSFDEHEIISHDDFTDPSNGGESIDNHHSCVFGGKCDITQSLSHPSNHRFQKIIKDTTIWMCQYCVAENAVKLRESQFFFFRDLFQQAEEGSLFIFTETSHRLWPEFVNVILSMSTLLGDDNSKTNYHGYQVTFPKHRGRGGSFRWDMVIHKKKGALVSNTTLQQCEEFQRIQTMHDLKLKKGFQRQRKKMPGEKVESNK